MKKKNVTTIHSHEKAFFNGSLETGLGSLNGGEMGFDLMTLINPLINKLTSPAPTVSIPSAIPAAVVKPATPVMTYVKYGAIAVGGIVGLALIMKIVKRKSSSKPA